MAKKATLTTITAVNNNISTLNSNFSALNNAFDNTLSLDGSTPNQMAADLDLNSNDLLNVQDTNTQQLFLAGNLVANLGFFPQYQGTWVTATAYDAYDLVYHDDGTDQKLYRSTSAHTAGTFATDLGNGLWEVFNDKVIDQSDVRITGGAVTGVTIDDSVIGGTTPAAGDFTTLGATGAVTIELDNITSTSDLPIADGGTGASTAAAARTNLGVEIGTNVQAWDASLDDIAAITYVAGDILYYDGSDLVDLPIGTAGYILATNSGGTAPEWVAPKDTDISTDTNTSWNVADADLTGGKIIRANNASAITITVPAGLTNLEPLTVIQEGAGAATFAAGTGATINSAGSALTTNGQYSAATLIPAGSDTYYLIGNITT